MRSQDKKRGPFGGKETNPATAGGNVQYLNSVGYDTRMKRRG